MCFNDDGQDKNEDRNNVSGKWEWGRAHRWDGPLRFWVPYPGWQKGRSDMPSLVDWIEDRDEANRDGENYWDRSGNPPIGTVVKKIK
jgi:hypothetical protein